MNTDNSSESGNFGQEFEKLFSDQVERIGVGKVVTGTIVDVSKEVVTVDIGFKSEGVIPSEQFQDRKGNLIAEVGDSVDVMVVLPENETGQVVLSKERADQYRVWREIEDKLKNDESVRGYVVQKVKGGLQVDIGIPAFLPGSQIDVRPHRNLDKFIDKEMEFKILKISREKGNIVVSRRAVLVSERDSLRSETLKVLSEGVVLEGIVKNITDYGAFIDLGGIDGLLHITDISWGRISHPSDRLSIGQSVPVVVLKYDKDNQRVSLGMKQLKDDPWVDVDKHYAVNKIVKGKVINITDYGAFVELEEGIDGLIHVSDMSWSKKVRHPSKIVSEGDQIEAVVLGIDTEEKKISLGLKQTLANPWEEFSRTHPLGTRLQGTVKSITDFGIFVEVAPDIDGLVHVSDFSWTKRIKDPKEIKDLFKKGDVVETVLLEIDIEGERLSLGIKQTTDDPWQTIVNRYPVGSKVKGKVTSITDFGVFVEIEEGVEGLVHLSQLGLDRGADPRGVFSAGQELECEITEINNEERRISLSVSAIRSRREKEEMAGFMEDSSTQVTFGDFFPEQIQKKDS